MILGHVDLLTPHRISGWVTDEADPARPLSVDIRIDGEVAATVSADRFRADLAKMKIGSGHKGFLHDFTNIDSARDHRVEVVVSNSHEQLKPGVLLIANTLDDIQPKGQPTPRHPDKRHVILHIGPPKTGTKYLQAALTRDSAQLSAKGILYPMRWWPTDVTVTHHQMVQDLRKAAPGLASTLREIAASDHHTLVFSCESFNEVSQEALRFLKDQLGDADYEVVYYARRFSDWAPSQWKQSVKNGRYETLQEFCMPMLANADVMIATNFGLTLDTFAEVFGTEAISIASYSGLVDSRRNIVSHFYRNFLDWRDPIVIPESRLHESVDSLTAEWMRAVNAILISQDRPTDLAAFKIIDEIKGSEDRRLIWNAMKKHVSMVRISDHAYPLRLILSDIEARYRNQILGDRLFDLVSTDVEVVRPDYLAEPGVSAALQRTADLVIGR